MKRLPLIILIAAISMALPSCSKFLEQSSQDLIRPTTVTHYKELLQGEGYFKDFYRNGWMFETLSDNIMYITGNAAGLQNLKTQEAEYIYKWAQDPEDPTGTFTDNFFRIMYKGILVANTCLEAVDAAEGSVEEKAVLRGQAHFTRAYAYFVLANIYAQAYNEASPDDPCVPMILNTTPTLGGYNRATMKEVWDLITNDIEAAVANLKNDKVTRTYYEINYKAALHLATRIYLYKEDYAKVIEYGEQALLLNPTLRNITGNTTSLSPSAAGVAFNHPPSNPEIVFTFGRVPSAAGVGSYIYYLYETTTLSNNAFGTTAGFPGALIDSYEADDRRKVFWFYPPTLGIITYPAYTPMKANFRDGTVTSQFFRSAEVYLNLAEAYARKNGPDNNKALQYLNELRKNRIANYTNLTMGDFANQDALVNFIWEERRRELCFEEFHRWWDLRRTGQPMLTHEWEGDVYVLQQKDPAYIMNFPRQELEFNPDLQPNPRPVRNP